MSDLSRALVDAAAEQFDLGEQWRDVYVDPELRGPFIRACVAAVLETLAASGAVLEDHDGDWQAALRGLAAEVKAVDDGG